MTPLPSPDEDAQALSHEDLLTLAHELRGALTVIAGYSDILRRPLDAEAQKMATDGIARAVQRADHLLEDALAGDSASALQTVRLDMGRVVENVVAEQRIATGRTIGVQLGGPAQVLGDEDSLSRLLGNLIDNAAKYSPDSSEIDVELRVADGIVQVSVLDRGPGIAEEHRTAAFEPLERLGVGDAVSGTGIGLAVVAQLADAHGGTVTIDDRSGGGAAITLELPLAS